MNERIFDVEDWISEYDKYREIEKYSFRSVCYSPFTTMVFRPDGDVIPCCWNGAEVLGNVKESSLKDIWFGDKAIDIRTSFKNYQFKKTCWACRRLIAKDKNYWETPAYHSMMLFTPENKGYPARIEFNLSNRCNLQCIMCNGISSSSIRKFREKLPPIEMAYDKDFIRQLDEFLPYLRQAYFAGGEPFMEPLNYSIWKRMVKLGYSQRIELDITTNGTIWNKEIEDMLLTFKKIHLNASYDADQKDIFESIRIGADRDAVRENLGKISRIVNDVHTNATGSLSITPMKQNWFELPRLFKLAKELNLGITLSYCHAPEACTLDTLDKKEIKDILNYLRMNEPKDISRSKRLGEKYNNLLNSLSSQAE